MMVKEGMIRIGRFPSPLGPKIPKAKRWGEAKPKKPGKDESMRWISLLMAAALLALPHCAWASDTDPGIPSDYVLAFSDEFSQDGPVDPERWTLEEGPARYNQELECYTGQNAWVEDGCLIIEARREEREGMEYTSARLNTQDTFSFRYGRLEARVALPDGRGTWSALWLLPSDTRYGGWLASGEIDLLEHVGYDPRWVHSTIHTQENNALNDNAITNSACLEGDTGAFHEYVLMWDRCSISTYLDGELLNHYRPRGKDMDNPDVWPFNVPFHLVMNLAVGGSWGGHEGVDADSFPQRMLVDYVRVYVPEENA